MSELESGVDVIRRQFAAAVAARKCHACGCLHETVAALERTAIGQAQLAQDLAQARAVFAPRQYDCIGCPTCYPALAANAFAEEFPGEADGFEVCPAEEPELRNGWPPLPGEYRVVRYRAPVAVCTLNSEQLVDQLADSATPGLAIVGTLHTENLGIERVIRNIVANPHVRFLILCGEDTQQAIGHLPGQSLASLVAHGIDGRGRIIDARGKRPVLKNLPAADVEAFRRQIELVDRIGVTDVEALRDEVGACLARDPGPSADAPLHAMAKAILATEPSRLTLDPAGYFVVYPDTARGQLALEHYTNAGVLDCVIEGDTPAALAATSIERGLVTRLDHAAYLGRELARAERSLALGERFVQDRAPGVLTGPCNDETCGCDGPPSLGGSK